MVFEKVNTGGKKLDAFELLTAIFAAENFELRKDWYGDHNLGIEGRLGRLRNHAVLKEIASTDFLQALCLLSTRDKRLKATGEGKSGRDLPPISCSRSAILELPRHQYERYADQVERGFILAARFLWSQKIYRVKDVPYKTQMIPLAAVLSELDDVWDQESVKAKVRRWFWCGIFGELYGSAIETRFANDFVELRAWIEGGEEPETVREANFQADRLDTMRSRLSAAYKGMQALLMSQGARDFRSGDTIDDTVFWDENVDIHHIFPRSWCQSKGIEARVYDAVVNKTPLTQRTNRIIGGDAPSKYLDKVLKRGASSEQSINENLESHLIHAGMMREDDFLGFYATRKAALLELIGKAMGTPIGEQSGQEEDEGEEFIDPEEVFALED